jgi:hypothetical protein
MRMKPSLRILLCAFVLLIISTAATGQVAISVSFGPPPLPVYEQPLCPGEGYIWNPGYWAWDDDYDDYYWVPGTWVLAPEIGFLWTPPWWGWDNGAYLFHEGWWGPEVGFYGGIVYGFGYFGEGYVGGRWEGDRFYYNRSVTNVNVVNVRNVYNENVTVRNENHVSFNGGPGGIQARPRPQDEAAARQRHIGSVPAQTQHLQVARANPELRATANHGKPPVAATVRPGEFRGGGAVPARQAGGEYHPPANRGPANRAAGNRGGAPENRGRTPAHPNDLPPMERSQRPNTGNSKQDQKYQQQQEKLFNRQNQERQRLQQRQDQEHQRMQANANQQRQQQIEQRHQQQTQQLQQRHTEQQQKLEQRYPRK